MPHTEDYQCLFIENTQLHKLLEAAKAQQTALDIENGELKIKGATLEKDNHAILYDLYAVQKANEFGNATLQSTKQHLQEVQDSGVITGQCSTSNCSSSKKAFLQSSIRPMEMKAKCNMQHVIQL